LPNEDKKLDSLRPGSREMEKVRREGQNFQPLREVQRLEEEVICSLEIGLIHFGFERGRKCIFLFGRIF